MTGASSGDLRAATGGIAGAIRFRAEESYAVVSLSRPVIPTVDMF